MYRVVLVYYYGSGWGSCMVLNFWNNCYRRHEEWDGVREKCYEKVRLESEEEETEVRSETASSTLTMLCQTNTQGGYNGEILYIALICPPTCTHL